MISKNEIKYLKSLNQKKFREEEKEFIAEGKNSVVEGLKSRYNCSLLLYTEKFISENEDILHSAKEKNIRCEQIGEHDFGRIADSVHPSGVLAVFEIPVKKRPDFAKINFPVIYFDEISDPGNAGTILRTCDWFGFRNVILSKNSADIYNLKTVRSSAGSLFHLNLFPDINIDEISDEAGKAGFKIFISGMNGEDINNIRWSKKMLIVFSNEANGVSQMAKQLMDFEITIPGSGSAESLNVASAAAVILFQAGIFLNKK